MLRQDGDGHKRSWRSVGGGRREAGKRVGGEGKRLGSLGGGRECGREAEQRRTGCGQSSRTSGRASKGLPLTTERCALALSLRISAPREEQTRSGKIGDSLLDA